MENLVKLFKFNQNGIHIKSEFCSFKIVKGQIICKIPNCLYKKKFYLKSGKEIGLSLYDVTWKLPEDELVRIQKLHGEKI